MHDITGICSFVYNQQQSLGRFVSQSFARVAHDILAFREVPLLDTDLPENHNSSFFKAYKSW
jgi:hypothetical protein